MQYLVISASADDAAVATEELQNDVQTYLDKGWRPQGGVCVVFSPVDQTRFAGNDGFEAFQALVINGEFPA